MVRQERVASTIRAVCVLALRRNWTSWGACTSFVTTRKQLRGKTRGRTRPQHVKKSRRAAAGRAQFVAEKAAQLGIAVYLSNW